ncbi:MAG: STAS domain-containing protein [Proteobacteria bacterium]|nr:STAS domain-containing protein [Pseudomonadota bacterium]
MITLEPISETPGAFVVRGALDIYAASEVRGPLIEALQQNEIVELHLAAVDEIDASGVQILLAAKQMASSLTHGFKLVSHSKPVLEALELCNLLAYFGDPVVEYGSSRPAKEAQG